jgi:DME family drug/metabolite transporter
VRTPAAAPATAGAPGPVLGRGLLLVCLAGVLWGTIGPSVPLAVEASGLGPLTVGALRGLVAAGVLLAAVASVGRLRRCWVLARPQWRRVVAVGVLTATFQQLFFVAVLWAGVSVATVVCLGFAPALLLVVGSVRERRPPAAGALATVVVAVVGLLLVGGAGSEGPAGSRPVVGVLAALAAGAAYGFSAEVGAPLSRRLDTLTMTTATMVVAAGVLLPLGLGLPLLRGEPVLTADLASWGWIVYLGVVTMAVAYALLFTGLRTTSSGTAVVASLLEPVTAVLLAVAFLGERLSPAGVLGSVLILLAIATLGRRTQEPAPQ